MTNNTKNYLQQGGEKWVIGGSLEVLPEAALTGLPAAEIQADSVATTLEELVTDFNSLLAKLKAAGLMANE